VRAHRSDTCECTRGLWCVVCMCVRVSCGVRGAAVAACLALGSIGSVSCAVVSLRRWT
jgi:hypothetical protein